MGLGGQLVYINPAAKVVVVVWSARPVSGLATAISDWAFEIL
jgi:hypothetical protein